ncbi:translation elongation factor 4 [bacterium]|nr:translation elongation factor 4 [bacterium]
MATDLSKIRNFSIIAHIDHGKSTLADRILEYTKTVNPRRMKEQVLDGMELERERGITIKARAIRLKYYAEDKCEYILNLIDTPGHVDFTYEVSRSMAACEGVLLLVDASQGIEAQTIANVYLARQSNLLIIPIINKIDLPHADVESVKEQIVDTLGLKEEPILTSAKQGIGTKEVLESVVKRIPPPQGSKKKPLRALIFDSVFDSYQGVVIYIKVLDGKVKPNMKIKMMLSGSVFEVLQVGMFHLELAPSLELSAGEVGYLMAGIKNVHSVKIGDTITDSLHPAACPHPGYKEVKPFVFCGFYPINTSDYVLLRQALEKLNLCDSSFSFNPETSSALGFGFRCGFLGLLHMDIIKERLEREYNLNLIITSPNVMYRIISINGEVVQIDNPALFPPVNQIKDMEEPFIKGTIVLPSEFVGSIMKLVQGYRGIFIDMQYITSKQVILTYELPLAEVVLDFYDKMKSVSKGYASFDYEHIGFRKSHLVRLDILISYKVVDALSFIIHKDKALSRGKKMAERLRKLIPRQQFEVPIQAQINNKIITRETVKALRKDVIAKCYGGDVSRKRKLLEKQKEGKKKMKKLGRAEIPQEAFISVLKMDD